MDKKVILSLMFIPIIISASILAIFSFLPTNKQNEENIEKTLENQLTILFTAENADDLDSVFDTQILNILPSDYLYSFVDDLKKHYGEFQTVYVPGTMSFGIYDFVLTLKWANISGLVGLNIKTDLINAWLHTSLPKLFNDYLENLTFTEILEEFVGIEGEKSLLVIRDNVTLLEDNLQEKLAVGSTFKLFVLEALITKINNDPSITWETKIPVFDKLDSLPSGEMHQYPNGSAR